MKKLVPIVLALVLTFALTACAIGTAENAALTQQYLPENVEYIRSEKDDGFTEHKYRDANGGEYTLVVDPSERVRVLEYDSKTRPGAAATVLTEEEAFAVITAIYPEAQLISAAEDRDDGKYEWNILFSDVSLLGFYELDAETGAILEYELFYSIGEVIDPSAIINANIPGAKIVEFTLDTDDGRLYVEGEAITENGKVEFSIDADSGTVVEVEHDD